MAAASEAARNRTLPYVELLNEARTKLEDFSVLLDEGAGSRFKKTAASALI